MTLSSPLSPQNIMFNVCVMYLIKNPKLWQTSVYCPFNPVCVCMWMAFRDVLPPCHSIIGPTDRWCQLLSEIMFMPSKRSYAFTQHAQTFGITPMYVSHHSRQIRQDHKLKVSMDAQKHTHTSTHTFTYMGEQPWKICLVK